MIQNHGRARAGSISIALAALVFASPALAATPLAGPAGGDDALRTDWDGAGTHGWRFHRNAAIDCAQGNPGCSLKLAPTAAGDWADASRDLDLTVPSRAWSLSADFRCDAPCRLPTRGFMTVWTDAPRTDQFTLWFRSEHCPGMSLTVVSVGILADGVVPCFAVAPDEAVWVRGTVVVDPETSTTYALAVGADGKLLGRSPSMPFFPEGHLASLYLAATPVPLPGLEGGGRAAWFDNVALTVHDDACTIPAC